MGKAARTRRSLERKKKKAAERQAKRDLYKKYSEEGRSCNAGRNARRRVRLAKDKDHPLGPCGNIGCAKCHPDASTG